MGDNLYNCVNCGGDQFDYGNIITAGLILQSAWDPTVYYESEKKKIFRSKTPLEAKACLNCGHVEMYISAKHLKKRIK